MRFNKLKASFDLPLQFWIIALIVFINAVSFTIIIPIIYPYAKAFGLSDFEASLLTTAYAVSQFLATPLLGRFSDFWGRKPLLVLSLVGTVLANLIASVAPAAWILFSARILDGLTGGNTSIASAVISDMTKPADRAKAFGLLDAAFRLGFITGPAISYVAQTLPTFPGVSPLGMSFFAGAAIALVATVLTIWLLPETLPHRAALKLSWQMFGLGKILQSVQRPRLGPVFLLTFFSGFTFTIFTFAFQPFFLNVLEQDAKALAIVFVLVGVAGILTQVLAVGPLSARFNLANLLCGALTARSLTFLLIPLFPTPLGFSILACLMGVANSFPLPLISSILSTNSGDREQGEILGINSAILSISNAIGPAVAGILVSLSYNAPFWLTAALTFLTAVFALRLKSLAGCSQAH